MGGLLGNQSDTNIQNPQVNPGDFTIGNGNAGLNQQAQNAQGRQAPQLSNAYAQSDYGAVQGALGNMQGLSGTLQQELTGQNSVAAAQMKAATDQSIAAQMAMANSAKGSLAAAGAERGAQMAGAQMQQNAAQQSMIGRLQEQQQAAAQLNALYQNQGQLALGEQGQNAQTAYQQAQLQAGQNALNDQMTLGSQGLSGQQAIAQLNAQGNMAQLQSGNQLAAQGQALQQGEFNAQQNAQMIGAGVGAAGALMAADADFQEPPGVRRAPAHLTLREETSADGSPFLLLADQNTGAMGKVATEPLSHAERHAALAPHGAGPIFGADRTRTTFHDMPFGGGAGAGIGGGAGAMPGLGSLAAPAAQMPAPAPGLGAQAGGLIGDLGADAGTGAGASGLSSGTPQLGAASLAAAGPSALSRFGGAAKAFGQNLMGGGAQVPPVPVRAPMRFADLDLKGGRYADAGAPPSAPPLSIGLGGPQFTTGAPAPPMSVGLGGPQFTTGAPPDLHPLLQGTPLAEAKQHDRDYDWIMASRAAHPETAKAPPPSVDPSTLSFAPEKAGGPGAATTHAAAGTAAPVYSRPAQVAASEQATTSPDRIAAIGAQLDEQKAAQAALGQAQAHQAEDVGVGAGLRGQEIGKQGEEVRAQAKAHDDYIAGLEGKLQGLSKEVAAERVDPDRWWKSRGTADKIRYTVAAALSGFAQGLHGGPNVALDQINRHVDRDIEAQRQAIESKKGQIGDMQGLLASAYRRFGNLDQATAAAHAMALQQVDEQQKAYAAGSNSEEALAKSRLLSAQLGAMQQEKIASMYKYVPAHTVGGGVDLQAAYRKYVSSQLEKPGGAAVDFQTFAKMMGGAGGESIAKAPGAAGKTNPQLEDQLAVGRQAIANIEALRDANGELPGTGVVNRHLPDAVRGTEARQLDGALWNLAEAVAHANGQRGNEAIESNVKAIRGNGSQQDLDAGLKRATRMIEARDQRAGGAGGPGAGASPGYTLQPLGEEE